MKKGIIILFGIFLPAIMFAQNIKVPVHGDKYSEYVLHLESGQTEIDYKAFRESLIESNSFKEVTRMKPKFDSLKKRMYDEMNNKNYNEVVAITKEMLSINYTSMIAHKILRQTYQILGDTANAAKYKAIQFGLLNSIVKNGDGKTCATAWPVIFIEEEYFILQMLGAKFKSQGTDYDGGVCDKMTVEMEGEVKVYYFDIKKIMEGYKKLGLK